MKKWLVKLLVVGLLVLDFLALDDITTGNEPNYVGEWSILVVSVVVFGVLIWSRILGINSVKKLDERYSSFSYWCGIKDFV